MTSKYLFPSFYSTFKRFILYHHPDFTSLSFYAASPPNTAKMYSWVCCWLNQIKTGKGVCCQNHVIWLESHRFIFLKSCLGLKEPNAPISNWFYIQEGIWRSVLQEGGRNSSEQFLQPGCVWARCRGSPSVPGGSDGKLLTSDGPSCGLCQENREGFGSSEDPSPQHSLH